MIISTKDWLNYINKLRRLSDTAAEKMQQYIQTYGFEDTDELIDFAHALVTKYGEGSAELACQMYDAIAEMEGAAVPPAVPAETATIQETARAVQGSLMDSPTGQKLSGVADRLVKQAAADTTLQNVKRDGAEWAWVPMGDTCGFCITLASRGWQRASQAQMRGNHASHIHAHCDCQFSIRFNGKGGVKGYDPDVYKKMYDEAEGSSSAEKVKSLRRSLEDRDKINAQKRAAYAKKKELEITPKSSTINERPTEYLGIPKTWVKTEISDDIALKGTNPNYNWFATREEQKDYNYNCSNCVPAYEMRLRGYDVSAQPLSKNKTLQKNPFLAWENIEPLSADGIDSLTNELLKYENGSRFQIAFDGVDSIWEKKRGHTMVAEKIDDTIVFKDPQTASIITSMDDILYQYARIDNAEISDRGVSACKKG